MKALIISLLVISSCIQHRPPEVIHVQAPRSMDVKVNPDSCFLFLLKKDKAFYLDHLDGNKSDSVEIVPYNKATIIRILDSTEQKHHIKMIDYENVLIVKGASNSMYSSFKTLKDALREKEITKIRLVTTGE